MPSSSVPVTVPVVPPPALRRYAWGVLVYFIAVILWGGLVRSTGSGSGCGNHWPLCNGVVLQHSPSVETMIEFTHRATSGLSFFLVVALLAFVVATTARGHLARMAAAAAVVFTVIEAALGALLVKLGLTAQSTSPLRPWYLALHLANTLLLLASLALAAHLLSRSTGFLRSQIRLRAPAGALACVCALLVVGVTGSLAALGDTLFPANSLSTALAQDLSLSGSSLIGWRWTHPLLAFLAGLLLIWTVLRAMRKRSHWDNRALAAAILFLLAAQFVLGLLDVILLAPVWLQIVHLLGADLLWVALVVLAARFTLEPAA